MKDFYVTISVEFGGQWLEIQMTETAWDEEMAKENAEERVRNNILIMAQDVEEVEE
jgi:hypothetical protein